MSDKNVSGGQRDNLSIYDVAPTILDLLDIEVPADMIGRSLVEKKHSPEG